MSGRSTLDRVLFPCVVGVSCLTLALSCAPASSAKNAQSSSTGPSLSYTIAGIDGEAIESRAHRGRVTALLFITTFDLFSQAQAARLEDLYRSHEPRINAAAIVLEPPKNIELVQAFVSVLNLSYSVGIADQNELSHQGLLGEIQKVPAWIILDREGKVSSSGVGSLSLVELEQALARAEE